MVETPEQSGPEGVDTPVEQPGAHTPVADHYKRIVVIDHTGGTLRSAVDSTPELAVGRIWHKDHEPVVRWAAIDRVGQRAVADQDEIRTRRG